MPTHYQGTEEERRALDLIIKLSRAAYAVNNRMMCGIVGSGITSSQFGVLDALYHLGPMTLGDVARKHLRSPNNITSVVGTMERAGLVERKRCDKDRRVTYLSITAKGSKIFEGLWSGHVERVTQAASVLTPEEQEQLGALCKKLGLGNQCHEEEPTDLDSSEIG